MKENLLKREKAVYLGDDRIGGAASYLSGVMKHFGIPFDRVDSTDAPPADFFDAPYSLYILSDYPRKMFPDGALEKIAANVAAGSGLLMIGGWESFHGQLGEYNESPLADVLPVVMKDHDDRRNNPLSIILRTVKNHPVTDGLPWETPPGIGGFNAVAPKPDAELLVEGIRVDLKVLGDEVVDSPVTGALSRGVDILPDMRRIVVPLFDGDSLSVWPVEQVPILVVGRHGKGRTAAFTSDVAPHWVGGFVDWGPERVTESIGDGGIEVGASYAKFWRNLVQWTAGTNGHSSPRKA